MVDFMCREPNDYALLVGVQDYPNYPPFDTLTGPHRDVIAIRDWLLNNQTGGGLNPLHCKELLSTNSTPLHEEVDAKLDEIFKSVNKSGGGRRLYVYFSGHGLASDIFGVDLCLVKWSLEWRRYALSSYEYKKLIGETGYFEEIVWWLDCCRTSKVRAKGMGSHLGVATPGGNNTRFFTGFATEFRNAAYEAEQNIIPKPGQAQGFFTQALLRALEGEAVSPGNHGVTAHALHDYLYSEVPRLAKTEGKIQNPVIENGLQPPATFGLATSQGLVTDITFSNTRNGIMVLNGPDDELKRDDANTGPWSISLKAGALHALEDSVTGETLSFRPSDNARNIIF